MLYIKYNQTNKHLKRVFLINRSRKYTIFGNNPYPYGSKYTYDNGGGYVITPRDRIFKRLHMISLKMSMILEQDQYASATVGKSKGHVAFTLKKRSCRSNRRLVLLHVMASGTELRRSVFLRHQTKALQSLMIDAGQ